jgi:hypothetical protein
MVSLQRPRIGFTCGSIEFLEQIKEFLLNNGISDCKIKPENSNAFALYLVRKNDIDHFYNSIYNNATYFLQRKYDKFGSYYLERDMYKNSVKTGKD